MRLSWKCGAAIAIDCLLLAGCDDDESNLPLAQATYAYVGDEAAWADYFAAVNYAFVDPIDTFDFSTDRAAVIGIPTANDLAAQSAAGVRNYYSPSSCVSSMTSGQIATVALNGCNGPLGVRNISGSLEATFQQESDAVVLSVVASVRISDRIGRWQVSGSATPTADGWTMTSESDGALQGMAGNAFARKAQPTISWVAHSGCIQLDSQGSVVTNGTTYASKLSGYQRCTGSCPTAGTLNLDGLDKDAAVTFDGSDNPAITSSTGAVTELPIVCGG